MERVKMKNTAYDVPLFRGLCEFSAMNPISFHVPGHKNGTVFPDFAKATFGPLLSIDFTELTGLDDLHAPTEIIKEAQTRAATFFHADETFFLVGGTTVGNLATILAMCRPGEKLIVQRNSHKSIANGLELAGATPIFLNPMFDSQTDRYIAPSIEGLAKALQAHPDAKGVVLTYPDYYGKTYALKELIDCAHAYQIPVLVDEAHGVHFALGDPFPPSALQLGADVVVQSAHKMAPAMTMASWLHIKSDFVTRDQIQYYLSMLQSSSPSYPLLASLDIARAFLASLTKQDLTRILQSAQQLKEDFAESTHWFVEETSDPLKITLTMKQGHSGYEVAALFEQEGIYPELASHKHILFIHGLGELMRLDEVKLALKRIGQRLKISSNHATIDISGLFQKSYAQLAYTYNEMRMLPTKRMRLEQSIDYIAAEAIIPYPPGIPLVLKGERITNRHAKLVEALIKKGATFQNQYIQTGILVFEEK